MALRGFSLVELAVALAVLSTLLYFILDRASYMQEMGEKTEVEEVIRSINYGLRLEAASRTARGADPNRAPLEKENPVKWLQVPPRNYLGEMENAPAHARPAYWYYDARARQLVYRPNRADHLRVEEKTGRELRFVVENGGPLHSPRLVARPPYSWFQAESVK